MIQITDHFLDLGSFMLLKDLLLGYQKHENHSSLPWTLGRVLSDKFYSGDNEDKHVDYNFHFCHTFYKNNGNESHTSQNINIIKPLIDKLVHIKNARSFRRIKVNLNIKSPSIIRHGFHVDFPDNKHMTTAVYYVNSNDGYTEFEDGTKVESVENRLVTFPSYMMHSGTTCTNQFSRCTININYF